MLKISKKSFFTIVCFSVLLFFGSFCLPIHTVFSANLEVQYPVLSDQTLTAETKLPDFIIYIFNFLMAAGFTAVFISLAIAGAMYFLSPAKPDLLASAKERASGAISGLLILVLTYLIITTINPQLNVFNTNELPAQTITTPIKRAPGVYLYKDKECPDKNALARTSNIPDLATLKNMINSVDIVQDPASKTSYISFLYENTNFWGKCQYINPTNKGCQPVTYFASSISIHPYDYNPNADGVYFFRKACFNKVSTSKNNISALIEDCKKNSGGWYKIDQSEIKGGFSGEKAKLENFTFHGVPEDEQTCLEYDKNENCTRRAPQNLSGENISSIIINGHYLVVFVYFGLGDTSEGIMSSCQEFPASDDVNKLGPQQMKWENIRNPAGVGIPNYVLIFPIKNY